MDSNINYRFQIAEEIEELLKQYRRYFGYVDLRTRKEPGKPLSAEELNSYVESRGLMSQNDLWIELSKNSAAEQLHILIDHLSEDYEVRDGEVGSPSHVTNLFMKTFSSSARFFTNGIYFHLSEYSIIEGTNTIMNVSHPFRSEASGRGLLNAWNPFKRDLDYDAIGVVAVDEEKMGFLLINVNL